MRMLRILVVTAVPAVAGVVAPVGASAQAPAGAPAEAAAETVSRAFTWLGNDLRVTIDGAAAGTIRLQRGGAGRVELTAGAVGGLASAALDPDRTPGELVLSAGDATRVDYIVVVPADARVSVRLAGQPAVTLGALERSAGWRWTGGASPLSPLPRD